MNELMENDVARCGNCGSALSGGFCHDCGQQDREVRRPFWRILTQLFHAIFELDGRVYRTLFHLYTRPGFLSSEYLSGRRARYTPPLRLFLVLSISFFLVIALAGFVSNLGGAGVADPSQVQNPDSQALQVPGQPVRELLEQEGVEPGLADLEFDPQQVRAALEGIEVPFLPAETSERLKNMAIEQAGSNYNQMREAPREFFVNLFSESLEYITFFILLMMPLLALIQMGLYFFKFRYYIEHFILTLHNHSFLIVTAFLFAFTSFISSLLPAIAPLTELLDTVIALWAVIYLYLSLNNFYRSNWFYSGVVFVMATIIYSALMTAGLSVFFVLAFFLY